MPRRISTTATLTPRPASPPPRATHAPPRPLFPDSFARPMGAGGAGAPSRRGGQGATRFTAHIADYPLNADQAKQAAALFPPPSTVFTTPPPTLHLEGLTAADVKGFNQVQLHQFMSIVAADHQECVIVGPATEHITSDTATALMVKLWGESGDAALMPRLFAEYPPNNLLHAYAPTLFSPDTLEKMADLNTVNGQLDPHVAVGLGNALGLYLSVGYPQTDLPSDLVSRAVGAAWGKDVNAAAMAKRIGDAGGVIDRTILGALFGATARHHDVMGQPELDALGSFVRADLGRAASSGDPSAIRRAMVEIANQLSAVAKNDYTLLGEAVGVVCAGLKKLQDADARAFDAVKVAVATIGGLGGSSPWEGAPLAGMLTPLLLAAITEIADQSPSASLDYKRIAAQFTSDAAAAYGDFNFNAFNSGLDHALRANGA